MKWCYLNWFILWKIKKYQFLNLGMFECPRTIILVFHVYIWKMGALLSKRCYLITDLFFGNLKIPISIHFNSNFNSQCDVPIEVMNGTVEWIRKGGWYFNWQLPRTETLLLNSDQICWSYSVWGPCPKYPRCSFFVLIIATWRLWRRTSFKSICIFNYLLSEFYTSLKISPHKIICFK